jgi:hypothetical protein
MQRLNLLSDSRYDQGRAFIPTSSAYQHSGQASPSLGYQFPDIQFRPVPGSSPHSMHSYSEIPSRSNHYEDLPRRSRPRSYSLPSSPQNVPSFGDDNFALEELHHSLPILHLNTTNFTDERIDETSAMHHSLPNIDYQEASRASNKSISNEMDMLPLDAYSMQSRRNDPFPMQQQRSSDPFGLQQQQQQHQHQHIKSAPSEMQEMMKKSTTKTGPSYDISKDFLSCLEKLTEHSIASDNPYEPIPLTPDSPQKLGLKAALRERGEEDAAAALKGPMLLTPPTQKMSVDIDREMFLQDEDNSPPFEGA